jgi:formate dehydrogenase accessory protein FdhE
MNDWWDRQIQRADQLAAEPSGSTELLAFYAQLLRAQKEIYEGFRKRKDWLPAGDLQKDLPAIHTAIPILLETVAQTGPEALRLEASALLNAESEVIEKALCDYWRDPSDIEFFAKAILQPYTRWLVETGAMPVGRDLAGGERTCPHCGGKPQVSFLQNKETTAESGNRDLVCGTCLSSWEFRRVVCANCGEERPAKLGYFHSPDFDHVRIEACDSCHYYIKGVDLTRLGYAEPLVEEISSAPLDLWAREHGYHKVELNLVGL